MLTILVGLLSLGVLILVHELGHFWMARRMGVRVLKFSIGFGPRLVGFRSGETEYVVSAIPLGGFVKMAGEEEPTGDPGELKSKPWWARALIAIAGPAANVVLAFVLLAVTALVGLRIPDGPSLVGGVEEGSEAEATGFNQGDVITSISGRDVETWLDIADALRRTHDEAEESLEIRVIRGDSVVELAFPPREDHNWLGGLRAGFPPVVGEVEMGMPAYAAGLQRGDSVVAIDDRVIARYEEMRDIVLASPESSLVFTLKRGAQLLDATVVPTSREVLGFGTGGLIGVLPMEASTRVVRLGFLDAVYHGGGSTVGMLGATYVGLYRIARHPIMFKEHLSGPVAIAQMSAAQARKGAGSLVQFIALIGIALAVMNLLPIPILDGGQVIFCLAEAVRGKPLKAKTELMLQRIGVTLLVSLMLFALVNDISRAVARRRAVARTSDQEAPAPGQQ